MKTLAYRLLTVGLVFMHYLHVEKMPLANRVENEYELLQLIVIWHVIFMNFKIAEESRRKKHEDLKTVIAIYIGALLVITLLVLLLTPFLAYFNFKVTKLDTNYWSLRYILMLFYIIFNILINTFPLVNNFLFFLSDGIILS